MILDMTEVPHIDQSGLYAMEEIAGKLSAREIPFLLVIQQQQPKEIIKNAQFLSQSTHVVHTIADAIAWLRENMGAEEKEALPAYIHLTQSMQLEKV
jgi:anti-anti-sigma regulatory factor